MAPVDDVRDRDPVKVIGYPTGEQVSYPTTLAGDVVEARLRFRHAVALKIQLPEVQASTPVRPRGLSGAPVVPREARTAAGPRRTADRSSSAWSEQRPGNQGRKGHRAAPSSPRPCGTSRHISPPFSLTLPAAPRRTPRGWLVGVAAAVVVLGSGTWWITTSHQPPPESSGIVAPSVSPSPSVTGSRSVSQTSSASDSRLLAQSPLPQGVLLCGRERAGPPPDLRDQPGQRHRAAGGVHDPDGRLHDVRRRGAGAPGVGTRQGRSGHGQHRDALQRCGAQAEGSSAAPRGGQTSSLHGDISGATRVWVQYYCSIHDATFTLQRPRISR